MELQQSHIQQVVFVAIVQQHSQAFGATKRKDILALLKLPLKFLHRLSHHNSVIKRFSKLVEIKTKKRSRLDCEHDMRVDLSKTEPSISQLVSNNKGNIK